MSITVRWSNDEKTILVTKFEGKWTWDENYQARDMARAMLDSVEHRVDCIYDLSSTSLLPQGLLPHAQSTVSQAHSNTGTLVIVTDSRFLSILFRSFKQVIGIFNQHIDVQLVSTLEAALELIADIQQGRKQNEVNEDRNAHS